MNDINKLSEDQINELLISLLQEKKARQQQTTDEVVIEQTAPRKVSRQQKAKKDIAPSRGPRRGIDKKTSRNFGRTESMQIGPRPNLFLDSEDFDDHKEDSKIDKLLNVKRPVTRMRPVNLVEVECSICGDVYQVNPSIIGKDMSWKCNDCAIVAKKD